MPSSSRPERRSGISARPLASIGRSRSPATTRHPSSRAAWWHGAAMQRGRSKPGQRPPIRRRRPIRSSLRRRCAPMSARWNARSPIEPRSCSTAAQPTSSKGARNLRRPCGQGGSRRRVQLDHVPAFDPAAMALKPKAELEMLFAAIPATPVINYCNTGHQAATNWFVLSEVLGRPGVSLYDGSMSEWTQEPIARWRWGRPRRDGACRVVISGFQHAPSSSPVGIRPRTSSRRRATTSKRAVRWEPKTR